MAKPDHVLVNLVDLRKRKPGGKVAEISCRIPPSEFESRRETGHKIPEKVGYFQYFEHCAQCTGTAL